MGWPFSCLPNLIADCRESGDYILSTCLGSSAGILSTPAVLKCMKKKMSPKTCVLDPRPTSLMFECSDQVVPLLTTIVNSPWLPAFFLRV